MSVTTCECVITCVSIHEPVSVSVCLTVCI